MPRSDTFRFEVPPATPQTAPFRQTFTLWHPVIVWMKAHAPKGHRGLAFMDVTAPGWVILSNVYGEDVTKETGTINLRLFGPPYMFECVGWNNDVILPHEFVIEVNSSEAE